MPPVLGAVEREHARPDHLGRREARVVNREPVCVAHDRDAQVAAGHEPAVEGGDPRHRLVLAKAGERLVRIGVELGEGQRGAERVVGGRGGSGQSASVRAGSRGQYRRGGGTRSSATRGRGRRLGTGLAPVSQCPDERAHLQGRCRRR